MICCVVLQTIDNRLTTCRHIKFCVSEDTVPELYFRAQNFFVFVTVGGASGMCGPVPHRIQITY